MGLLTVKNNLDGRSNDEIYALLAHLWNENPDFLSSSKSI